MTEEMKEWKRVLDTPIEHYLECIIPESEREQVEDTYNTMFQKMMEKQRLLNAYRKENFETKAINDNLRDVLHRYKSFIQWVTVFSSNEQIIKEGTMLLGEELL